MFGDYEVVIGLEIHAQLSTDSKLFSTAPTEFGSADNENVSFVCAGMPGTLPVLNEKVIELAVKSGLALNCEIQNHSTFARKQYFYPDLPKGYQISQFDRPICGEGRVDFYVNGEKKSVKIERAHLEEDAGKSTHFGEFTLINLNRAGVPLLEIVSAPVMHSPQEAACYAKAVRQILLYIGACNGNLEEGSLRCDCNVSVRKKGATVLGTRVELKNINSFRFIEKAIEYEARRQIDCLQNGEALRQETRLYDATKNKTFTMRSKEEADDYRYFQDPDIMPVTFDDEFCKKIQAGMGELPIEKMNRLQSVYGLSLSESEWLCSEKEIANYFEITAKVSKNPKLSANWIIGEVAAGMNDSKIPFKEIPVSAENLGRLLQFVEDSTISGKMAKTVFENMWKSQRTPDTIIQELGLKQISDEGELLKIIQEVLEKNKGKVEQYKQGKEKLYGFFVGQVMKETKGQGNPEKVNQILKKELSQ